MEINKESVDFAHWVLNLNREIGFSYKEFIKTDGIKISRILNGFNIKEKMLIAEKNPQATLLFENSVFDEITFESSNLDRISFINCTINKLIIKKTSLNGVVFVTTQGQQDIHKINSLTIINSDIKERYLLGTNVDELTIAENTSSHHFSIDSVVNKLIVERNPGRPSIKINSYVQNCEISCGRYPFTGPIYVGDFKAEFVDIIYMTGCANNIHLVECSKSDIDFDHLRCLNDMRIYAQLPDSNATEIKFLDCYIGGMLQIEHCNCDLYFFKNDSNLQYLNYNVIEIKGHLGTIKFQVAKLEYKFVINTFKLEQVFVKDGKELKLSNINCWSLVFDDFRCNSTGSISDLAHGNWLKSIDNMDALITQHKLEISDKFDPVFTIPKSSKPSISLLNSNLGKMELMNVDLSKFELLFHSSKLSDIYITGTELPTMVKSVLPTSDKKAQFRQQKIAYTQLKKINEQHGDYVNANIYYAREMNAHLKYLKFKEEPFEVINLGLSKVSSNHGQSIKLAFWSTLGVSIVSYILFCGLLGYSFDVSFSNPSLLTFSTLSSYFPEFINPVHRLETFYELTPDGKITNSARALDGVSRVVLAYFLYQFIQAFRKHGRSK